MADKFIVSTQDGNKKTVESQTISPTNQAGLFPMSNGTQFIMSKPNFIAEVTAIIDSTTLQAQELDKNGVKFGPVYTIKVPT